MVSLMKYFFNKNLAFTSGFIIEIFRQQKCGVYLWFYYSNISLVKTLLLPMVLLLKYFVTKILAFTYGFILKILHYEKFGVYQWFHC